MNRKFSIPYNGISPKKYFTKIKPYIKNIHSVFCGMDGLLQNHFNTVVSNNINYNNLIQSEDNCYEFLKLSKGLFKRLIVLNSGFYSLTTYEIKYFVQRTLSKLIEEDYADGFILTDFNMARFIHESYPNLELHTSCNCFQWNLKTMEMWQKYAGISVFNPPREILRTPKALKEMHKAGFKLKCLVNESCLYGCPQVINHIMYLADRNILFNKNCLRNDVSNLFRSNWVIPRWLEKLDPYVDIYKISGRRTEIDYIINTLRAYITGDDNINLLDLVLAGTSNYFSTLKSKPNIPVKLIPDKLLTCECKNCNKGCNICSELSHKLGLDSRS